MPGSILKAGARTLIFQNSPRIFIISILYIIFITVVSGLIYSLVIVNFIQVLTDNLYSGVLPDYRILITGIRPVGFFLALILTLLQPVLDVGFISYCLKVTRMQDTEIRDLFNGFLFFTRVLLIFIIQTVFIFLWSLLFIIPGIVASYRYRLAYYILLDDPKKGALQCISESALLMNGRKLDLLTLDISFIGWYILDFAIVIFMPFPFFISILSIWISPYVGLTRAAFYESLVADVAV